MFKFECVAKPICRQTSLPGLGRIKLNELKTRFHITDGDSRFSEAADSDLTRVIVAFYMQML